MKGKGVIPVILSQTVEYLRGPVLRARVVIMANSAIFAILQTSVAHKRISAAGISNVSEKQLQQLVSADMGKSDCNDKEGNARENKIVIPTPVIQS